MCELTFDNDNEIEQQINLLKLKTCYNAEDKEAIRNAMKATFQHRKAWIEKESPTLDSILSKYPKFILLPNLVIIFLLYLKFFCFFYFYKNIFKLNDDFKLSYEANSDNFIMEWFSLSSKIIKYGLSCKEEGIKAFSEEISNSLENLNENGKYLFLNLT